MRRWIIKLLFGNKFDQLLSTWGALVADLKENNIPEDWYVAGTVSTLLEEVVKILDGET